MSESEYEADHSSRSLHDILFILFRHKWKIILFGTAGVVAAAVAHFLLPRNYESEAKLFVRYVVERSAIDSLDSQVRTPGSQGENIISSEVEILTSWDLAMEVAEAVGVDRLLRGSGGDAAKTDAARSIRAARSIVLGLNVTALKGSNIISISYKNSDPELTIQVLQELVTRYFDKHLEVHRSVGAFEFVTRETDRVHAELAQTDEELKELKAKAGITSLAESTATLNTQLAKGQEELDTAEAELAEQNARVKQIEKMLFGVDTKQDNGMRQASSEVIREYEALIGRVAHLRQMETELLAKYTPQNNNVKATQAQIAGLKAQARDMEMKYPGLLATLPATASPQSPRSDLVPPRPDLVSERARLAAIEAKTETLKSRQSGLHEQAKVLSEVGPRIMELERTKEVQEANYKYFEASLEKARIDETLDPSRMPNISVVQKPSPAVPAARDTKKILLGLAAGGWAAGIAIALLIELMLDRTVKRRLELETRLRVPLLVSIPDFARNGHLRLRLRNGDHDSDANLQKSPRPNQAPWENSHFIRPFCEAIRDRLIAYFERNRITQKPRFVALTGCSAGAGASTLAAGLAASLSEACDSKVLLVDKQVDSNRFFRFIAELRASDFEYVIFDMPAVSQTSTALPLAGFMDKVLLIVEAEVSNREVVKRAYAELAAGEVSVSVVFNKSRSYGPKWLQGDL